MLGIIAVVVTSLGILIWLERLVLKYYKTISKSNGITLDYLYYGILPYTVIVLFQTTEYVFYNIIFLSTVNLDSLSYTPLVVVITNGFLIPVLLLNLILSIKVSIKRKSMLVLLLPICLLSGVLNVFSIRIFALVGIMLFIIKLTRGSFKRVIIK